MSGAVVGPRPEVPPDVLARLRGICLRLPLVREEAAWVGVRRRVRTRTFAHVLVVADGWPPAYARAAGVEGRATVVTFRSSGPELDALGHAGPPYFRPPWGPQVVGVVLDGRVGRDELAELLTESYCLLAPRHLAALVDRPGGA